MAEFDLRQIIRDVLDSTDEPDPHKLVPEVSSHVDGNHVRAAFEQLLPQAIRQEMSVQAGRLTEIPTRHEGGTGRRKGRTPNKSAKWNSISQTARIGMTRHYVPTIARWVLFKELTYEWCMAIKDDRYRRAAGIMSSGDWYESVARKIVEHGAQTVGDLLDNPETASEVTGLWEDDAAAEVSSDA